MREARAAAQADDLARQRAEFRARTPAVSHVAVQAAQAHREALHTIEPVRTVSGALPPMLRAVARGHTPAPYIWRRDVKKLHRRDWPDVGKWIKTSVALLSGRDKGEPLETTLEAVIRRIARCFGMQKTGQVIVTYNQLAGMARGRGASNPDTICRAVRCLERLGVLDTQHSREWTETGEIANGPNVYRLRDPETHPMTEEEKVSPLARAKLRIVRYAASWGLQARDWGFNVTASPAPDPRRALRET